MKPPPFEYRRAASLQEALEVLSEYGERTKPIAGGQSLVPLLNMRLVRPELLLDLNHLDLAQVRPEPDEVALGALVRHATLERHPVIRQAIPLLAHACRFIGYPAIRHRGTLGGSLCHADPTAELALVCVALDARLELASVQGRRTVAAADFFQGPYTTALRPDELMVEVRLAPQPPGERWGFYELAERAGDFALAAAAARVVPEGGRIARARVVVGGGGLMPAPARAVEGVLAGQTPSPALCAEAARVGVTELRPLDDPHVSADFRRELLRVAMERALAQALRNEGGIGEEGAPCR